MRSKGIRMEDVAPAAVVGIDHCGAPCGTTAVTMSSRIYNVWSVSSARRQRA